METKSKYIIIAVIAVILIIAAIVAVVMSKSNTNTEPDNDETYIAEESGDSETFEPVSMYDDIQVEFENIDDSLAEEFEEHDIITTLTTAYHPENTTIANTMTTDKTTTEQSETTTMKQETTTKKQENTTVKQQLEQTTVKTEVTTSAADPVLSDIDSFFKGKYYFDGTMATDGSSSPFEIAMNGSDFIVYSEMDGIDLGILSLGKKLYLVNPADKKYTVINSAVQSMMDIDADSLKFEFNNTGFNGYSPTSVTEARLNGTPAVCYSYKDSKNSLDFVVVNNEIRQIVQYDINGNPSTILYADEFTVNYSTDMVSLNGLKKTNLLSFMSDLMGGMN